MDLHDVFRASFLKSYVKYVDHVIDWSILQVDPEGEFQSKHQCILQRNMLMLWN